MTNQTLYQAGLAMAPGISAVTGRQLVRLFGSAEAVFTAKGPELERLSDAGKLLVGKIRQSDALKRAEKELLFIEKNRITCFFATDAGYPERLAECPDAPLLLYAKGNVHLEAKHVLSIVGTRNASAYGREQTEKLLADLAAMLPGILIVSGLAYGIDISAHRSALAGRLPTAGVLAHGLDRIYPAAHRQTAIEMLENGGLLTDFPSGTQPDRYNFVKRNRIIAGLSDATLVMESACKGGSLLTAEMAFSYNRNVFAFPGRASDTFSEGCNRIIRQNQAALVTCAADLMEAMGWNLPEKKTLAPAQTELFPRENEKVTQIYALLKKKDGFDLNELAAKLDLPVSELSPVLFEMEMNGKLKMIPGNRCKLV
ncbi:MAG: DNA-processing protein DprA [Tannerellaceae bacterium]|jgi:DNA processing protein|nr:DNA-processing protein DprA [Tannerellaceae bacterium]